MKKYIRICPICGNTYETDIKNFSICPFCADGKSVAEQYYMFQESMVKESYRLSDGNHLVMLDCSKFQFPYKYEVRINDSLLQTGIEGIPTRHGLFCSYTDAKEYFNFVIEQYDKENAKEYCIVKGSDIKTAVNNRINNDKLS